MAHDYGGKRHLPLSISRRSSFFSFFQEHNCPKLSCDVCGQKMTSESSLWRHCKQRHAKQLTCQVCWEVCGSKAIFDRHDCSMRECIPCDECDKTFTFRNNLMRHKKRKHNWTPDKDDDFQCEPTLQKEYQTRARARNGRKKSEA